MLNEEENIRRINSGLNASPYTIASLIGTTELGKMGIIFPDFVAGINQNMKRRDIDNSEALKSPMIVENIISDSQNKNPNLLHSLTQNTQILKIQEPICMGKSI